MCSIILHGYNPEGKQALVSETHAPHVLPFRWILGKDGYARKMGFRGERMHAFVMSLEQETEGKFIDHINRDRLDNRIENLRLVLPIENAWNRSLKPMSNIKRLRNGFKVQLVRNGEKLTSVVETLEEAQNLREAHRF